MKSINKICFNKTSANEYMQAISACTHCRSQTVEERKPLFEDTRQLYATEAEDYFFYFVPVREDEVIGIAI